MLDSRIVGPLMFLFIGIIFFGVGASFMYGDYAALKYWKIIKAQVTDSYIENDIDSDGYAIYYPHITYKYNFKGQTYTGSCCDDYYEDTSSISKLVKRYHAGVGIDIVVDPNNPGSARVKEFIKPFNLFNIVFVGLGAISAIIGAYSIYRVRASN